MKQACVECDKPVDLDYGEGRLCFDCAADARRGGRTVFAEWVEMVCWGVVLVVAIGAGWVWLRGG